MVSAAVKWLERDLREIVRSYFQPLRSIQKDASGAVPVLCGQCGESIVDESPSGDPAQRGPSPKCGSTVRAFSVEAHFTASAQATVQAEVVTYPQNLLFLARTLIDEGRFGIAVIVAHLACEIATERSLSEAFVTKGLQYLEASVDEFLNGCNLANDRFRKLYSAMTGDEIQTAPFWNKFKESAQRRNNIIHGGTIVGKTEAEESYRAAADLVAHLKK
jgi:hypothetical protein